MEHLLAVCPAGSYSDGRVVTMCPRGQYQDEKGQSSCKQCPSGKTTAGIGSIHVSECSGMFLNYTFSQEITIKINMHFRRKICFWKYF